jgi:hypothetical protein
MAVSATFVADFSRFESAVDHAQVTLRDFSSGIGRVDKDLAKFGDQFSGVKLFQDATLMAEAVERVGGVSKLTESEIARLASTLNNAAEKMQQLGVEAPPQIAALSREMVKLAESSQRADRAFADMDATYIKVGRGSTNFQSGLMQVDRALAASGINVGSYVGAINELGTAMGKTVGQVGALGVAGGVLAAGMAGWNIGRRIAEFFELDETIADAMNGFEGSAQRAAIQVVELSRATQAAGRSITSMTEAARINAEESRRMAEEHKKAAAAAEAAFDAFKRARADAAADFERQDQFREGLIGNDMIAKAREYLVALQILREQGLQPLKSKHEEISGVMRDAMTAMENLGQTGTLGYQRMAAELQRLQPLLKNTADLSRLIFAPAAVEGQGVTAAVQAAELAEWLDKVAREYEDLDAEVEKYYRIQGIAFDDTVDGATRATAAINGLAAAMSRATFGPTVAAGPGYVAPVVGRPTFGSLQPGPMHVTVNAQNSFYDTPESINRLANRVGDAVMNQVRTRGGLGR